MLNRDEIAAVLLPFSDATPLPRAAFVDADVFELEERALFSRSWIPVAHVADLTRPGDWVRAPVRGEHLIVMRGADLELAALHAVCSHRGALLCDGERGQVPELELRCPYHLWAYGTDGALLSAPGMREKAADRQAFALARARVAVHAGVVFVNLDTDAADLAASWNGGPPWLQAAGGLALERISHAASEVRANWKVLVGNFQESHHFPSVHPGLERRTPWTRSTSLVQDDAWLGGTMELADDCETVSRSGKRCGRPFVAPPADRRRVLDAFVFPLWLTSLQPDYLLTYRLAPLAVDRTQVVAEIHVHPGARGPNVDLADVVSFWDRTNAEDRRICELQQRGLESRRARPAAYCTTEDGLHAFERLVAARYLRALSEEP